MLLRVLFVVLLLPLVKPVQAHELDPGYVDLRPFGAMDWSVYWRQPDVEGKPLGLDLVLPQGCQSAAQVRPKFDGKGWSARWIANCGAGQDSGDMIGDGVLRVNGLHSRGTDVLVRVQHRDGNVQTALLTPSAPQVHLVAAPAPFFVLKSYGALGFWHILEGYDHLLFVLALLLLVKNRWRLVGAITAFTVAHSITLALAALQWITVPAPPVEAVIALSIVFLALEILRQGRSAAVDAVRNPWVVCFLFGLLHGLGFAGALRGIGLPDQDIVVALLGFNLGVEAGQLVFVLCFLAGFALFSRVWPFVRPVVGDVALQARPWGRYLVGYAIGGVATFWCAQRIAGFVFQS